MESKEGIEALFLYATEGIIVINENGEITMSNPSTEKLFNYNKGELIGKKIEVLIPKRVTENHAHHLANFNKNPHARSMGVGLELYGVKKDGQEFPVEISLSPYSNAEGKFVIAFIIDITVRKLAEEKLKNYSIELETQVKNRTLILEEAIQELEKTKKELYYSLEKERELNELKSRFLSMASHEFRTPLTTIMSSLSLINKYAEMNDTDNRIKHIGKIKNSINNLTDILNDFLSLGKLEEGKIDYVPMQIDLPSFIHEIVSEMKTMVKNNQNITYHYAGKDLASIDKKLLKNIMFNLISNAIKFTPDNGKIEIKTEVSPENIKIIVKDNGMGIMLEDQKHLFERFYRGYNATHIQGTGLGLHIVTKYIELMNASISFESEENKGTLFKIVIPQK